MPPCIGISNWNLAIFPVFKMRFTSKTVYMYILSMFVYANNCVYIFISKCTFLKPDAFCYFFI